MKHVFMVATVASPALALFGWNGNQQLWIGIATVVFCGSACAGACCLFKE